VASGSSLARFADVPAGAVGSPLARYGGNPHALVQVLREAQAQHGWLPRAMLAELAERLGLIRVQGARGLSRRLALASAA
jgi:[NiFe] hydrogenase diaphorase moiety large subunit